MIAVFLSITCFFLSSAGAFHDRVQNPAETLLDPSSRTSNAYFKVTKDEMSKCRQGLPSCDDCIGKCKLLPTSSEMKKRTQSEEILNKIDSCHEEYRRLRDSIPEWCINTGLVFGPVPGYVPTEKQCRQMSKTSCASKWMADVGTKVTDGKLRETDAEVEMAKRVLQNAEVLDSIQQYKTELESFTEKMQRYEKESEQSLLSQAQTHISNPSETETVFAHPIYIKLDKIKEENEYMNNVISKQDIYVAGEKNQAVRGETIEKIPHILTAILRLESAIHSKKNDTDQYVQDIKDISVRTAELQNKAINLKFQKAHTESVGSAIGMLDKELHSLLEELRNAESIRIEANKQATQAKLHLMAVLRSLVEEISAQQLKTGCDRSQLISP